MPIVSLIVLVSLCVSTVALLGYWTVGIVQIVRTTVKVPTARAGLTLARSRGRTPSVCVIIASYNEEKVIEGLLNSLRAQDYPNVRFIMTLDRCTDGTAAICRRVIGGDPRFVIHEVSRCREGWTGKVSAMWSTVSDVPSVRDSEYLLFADADTIFSKECVSASVALLEHRGVEMLSLISTLQGNSWFELLVQPATSLELMRQYPIIRANRDQPRRAFANGQFMLFKADAYAAIGGHQEVRFDLLEDLALARRMEQAQRRVGVVLADDVLYCRMYPSWSAFANGWQRIFIEAANRRSGRLVRNAAILRIFGTILPVLSTCLLVWMLVEPSLAGDLHAWVLSGVIAGIVAYWSALLMVYRLAHAPIWAVPGFPVGAWIAGWLMRRAANDLRSGTPIAWGGKSYVLEDR